MFATPMTDNANMGRGDLLPRIITNFGIRIARADNMQFESAAPVNLSETGLSLRIQNKLDVGEQVRMQIQLDPDAALPGPRWGCRPVSG